MTVPSYARIAGKLLARARRVSPAPPSAGRRAEAIAVVERAIADRARARRRDRRARVFLMGTAAVAAAAACVALAAGVAHRRPHVAAIVPTTTHLPAVGSPAAGGPAAGGPAAGGPAVVGYAVTGAAGVVASGAPSAPPERRALATGSRLVTPPGGRVMLSFATGTQVLLGEVSDVTLAREDATQALRLDHGSLDLHVAKLGAGQRFLVQTPDAEVEVRGTVFTVQVVAPDPACGAGTVTRVAVTEGVVAVRHEGEESRVPAGQAWPAGCADGTTAAPGPSGPAPARTAASRAPVSSLGDQNDLFAEAIAAVRRGDASNAMATLDRFLARYPESPLAENAMVERMRLLRATDTRRAVVAAKQYLASHPRGFARAEAEAIIAGSP